MVANVSQVWLVACFKLLLTLMRETKLKINRAMGRYFKVFLNKNGNNEIIVTDAESSLFVAISELNVNNDHITKVVECDERGQEFDTGERQLTIPDVMPRISHKDCDCSELKHKIDRNQFPYGDDIEYDECPKCGARYNLHCL